MALNLVLLFIVGILASHQAMSRTLHDDAAIAEYEQWMAKYGIRYPNQAEKEKRFKIFKENLEYIENSNNAGNKSYTLSLNEFSDLTREEFIATHTGLKNSSQPTTPSVPFTYAEFTDVPTSIDWREKGVVTRVKSQGKCGSCWAFGAVAAIEGIHQIKTGTLIALSEKQVLDCNLYEEGCDGGFQTHAFEYIMKNGGLTSDENYPYVAKRETCNTEKQGALVAHISNYTLVPTNSEAELVKAASNQPISVSIEAGGNAFRHYKSGIFTGECGTDLDHAVTVVGFGTSEDGTDYWLVKNSWSDNWGESGYIRMKRNVEAAEGLCGIASGPPSYPII